MANLIEKYLKELDEKIKSDKRFKLIFRGQADETWKLESSASRRIKNNTDEQELKQGDMIKYHHVLIERAKQNLKRNERIENVKSDLELLAEIQHLGGATCLTDFTSNFLISLWFASSKALIQNKEEQNGKVFVINLYSYQNLIDLVDLKQNNTVKISEILTVSAQNKRNENKFYAWQPLLPNKRIFQQDSYFLFGLPAISEKNFHEIIIEKGDKQELRRQLKKYFNIDVENVFPDFHGFAYDANNPRAPFNDLYCKNCLEISLDFLEDNNFNEHKKYIEKAVKCKSQVSKTCSRNNEICEIDEVSEIYWNIAQHKRKNAKTDEEKLDVIEAFKEIIKLDSQFKSDCFILIADIYYDLGRSNIEYFKQAIIIYEKLLEEFKNDEKYNFCLFSIIELSIFSNDKNKYDEYIKIIENEKYFGAENARLLLELFKHIGNYTFNNIGTSFKNLNSILNSFYRNKRTYRFNNNFIWFFDDMKNWLSEKYPNMKFEKLFKRIVDIQNLWIEESIENRSAPIWKIQSN